MAGSSGLGGDERTTDANGKIVYGDLTQGAYLLVQGSGDQTVKVAPMILTVPFMVDGTCVEMLKNRRHRRDNTSGLSGVYKLKNGKYRVTLGFNGRRYYLGTFENYDEAKEERLKAERIVHDGFVEAYYKWKLKESRDPDWAKTHPFIFEVRLVNGEFEITTNIE